MDPEFLKSPRPYKPQRPENMDPEVSSSKVGDCEAIEYELGTFNIPHII